MAEVADQLLEFLLYCCTAIEDGVIYTHTPGEGGSFWMVRSLMYEGFGVAEAT